VICTNVVRSIETPDDFKNWLLLNFANQPIMLKAFIMRKYPVTLRMTNEQAIDLITEYMFTTYRNINMVHVANNEINMQYDLIHLFREILLSRESEIIETPIEDQMTNSLSEIEGTYMVEILRLIFAEERIVESEGSENIELTLNNCETDTSKCECSICLEEKELNSFVKFGCQHEFCNVCVIKTLQNSNSNNVSCALCRAKIQTMETRRQDIHDELEVLL